MWAARGNLCRLGRRGKREPRRWHGLQTPINWSRHRIEARRDDVDPLAIGAPVGAGKVPRVSGRLPELAPRFGMIESSILSK